MPLLTRRAAAANIEKSIPENDGLPPPESMARSVAQRSNKGTTTTVPKLKTRSTSKKASKPEGQRNRPDQHAHVWSQPSTPHAIELPVELSDSEPVELPIGPSAHSGNDSDEADESTPKAKSSIHVSGLFPTVTAILKNPVPF
jgi:hypothetical protein